MILFSKFSRARASAFLLLAAGGALTLRAQTAAGAGAVTQLAPMVVQGRETDLVGTASAASQGLVGTAELDARPFLRRGELLEVIPGVIITQHSGDGKANQYFLRGFNLDHGTDFASTVDGMPVNLPSNAHGQGYSDLNFIIPELVQSLTYQKGTYFAENGDFSAAGAAQFHLVNSLPHDFVKLELGDADYFRLVAGGTIATRGGGATTVGGEVGYDNGPWTLPEGARHVSGFARHTWTSGGAELAVTALAYHAEWRSTDQVPERAIADGLIGRFGNIDPSDGGVTSRASLSFDWTLRGADTTTHLNLYAISYQLNLFSDFTYFLDDPVHGDQFNQRDRRGIFGGSATRERSGTFLGRKLTTVVGVQGRADTIDLGLLHTEARAVVNPVVLDSVHEDSGGVFGKSTWQAADWFRAEAGLRADATWFDVAGNNPLNSGTRSAAILSPKLNFVFGPWDQTEFYLDAGDGFHSNDARGVVEHVDPSDGSRTPPVTPLVRAKGLEAGVRTGLVHGLVSTVSVWLLDLDSELTFNGDAGGTDVNGPTRRYGVEFANFYRATPWLAFDADVAFTHARYREETNGGFQIANSIGTVVTGGVAVGGGDPSAELRAGGWFGSVRARYFGPQPIVEDNTSREPSSLTFNARAGWRGRNWEFAVDVLNLFDRPNDDIAYYYASRLPGEPAAGVNDVHLHPAEPFTLRASVTRRF